jgi:hypothetical protein
VITVTGTEGQHPVKTGIGSRTVTHPAKQAAFSGNLVKFTLAVQIVGLKVRPVTPSGIRYRNLTVSNIPMCLLP